MADFLRHEDMRSSLRQVLKRLLAFKTEFHTFMCLMKGFHKFLTGLERFVDDNDPRGFDGQKGAQQQRRQSE